MRSLADEVPFDIPDSWEWVRLGELFQHNTGKALNASNRTGQLKQYITTSNLYWDRFELDNLKEMHFSDSEVEKCTVVKGDLLVCEGGDIGRAAIWSYDYPMCIQNHIHRLRAYLPLCIRFFYYLFDLYKHAGWIGGKGIGIQGLSSNAIHSLLFPFPPLAEQYRIVDAIDTMQPYADSYAIVESSLDKLNSTFPEALKKSILQEAVQGKLVPQDPSDEPAEALLERIRAEKQRLIKEGKIKKDKHESVIFRRDNSHYEKRGSEEVCIDEEIPFEIPSGWSWSRLGTCLDVRDGTHDMAMKVLYEKESLRLLGAQIVGGDGVDKRIDVLATAIRAGMTALELTELDLAYAPPYSSAKDPVNMAGFMIEDLESGKVRQFHWNEVEDLPCDGNATLLDVRTEGEYRHGHLNGFRNIPLDDLREHLDELDRGKPVYVNCQTGLRSYLACRLLTQYGFSCSHLSGGYSFYQVVTQEQQTARSAYPCGMEKL